MTRAPTLLALLLASITTVIAGCGSSSGAPSAEAAPARPVRLADHETPADPETGEAQPEGRTIAVTAPSEDGPHADPPPVEPPAFEE